MTYVGHISSIRDVIKTLQGQIQKVQKQSVLISV